METEIPVWAVDADTLDGQLQIRPALDREELGRQPASSRLTCPRAGWWSPTTRGAIAVLFGDVALGHGPSGATEQVRLFAIQVAGVPAIHVEEAFWTVREILAEEG